MRKYSLQLGEKILGKPFFLFFLLSFSLYFFYTIPTIQQSSVVSVFIFYYLFIYLK